MYWDVKKQRWETESFRRSVPLPDPSTPRVRKRLPGETLDLYRMAHVGCPSGIPHGPVTGACNADILRSKPFFGWTGRKPYQWTAGQEVCTVTRHQARYWWDEHMRWSDCAEFIAEWLEAGWQFVHYRVPVQYCREDRGQVIIPISGLKEWKVANIGIPSWVFKDDRSKLTNIDWHDKNEFVAIYQIDSTDTSKVT